VSVKDKTLHTLARSNFARNVYESLRKIPGMGSAIEKLVRSAIPPASRFWIQIPAGLGKGLWMDVDPRFDVRYMDGGHEPWIQELLTRELQPGDCYFDVGAHTGFFAMIAARVVGPSGCVVAFEADPENAALLKANVERNALPQVGIVRAAVWSRTGEVNFERGPAESNRMQGHISEGASAQRPGIAVQAVSLDEMVFERGMAAPKLVKIDIEGAEWGALQGARRLLDKKKPRVLCEVHDPSEVGKIQNYLRELGYSAEERKPAHEFYESWRELYVWAKPALQGAVVEAGQRH
jgi:FkbM family methyltransferase